MNTFKQIYQRNVSIPHSLLASLLPIILFLLGISFLSACASTNRASPNKETDLQQAVDYYQAEDDIRKINDMILSQAQMNSDPGEYLLGEGDLLKISVFEAEELDATVRINSRGFITLPLIEIVHIKGLTAIEAEEKIETLYKKGYIKNPHVSIFVEEHISQRITLVGQFKSPGTYNYSTKQRLLDAIAMGGGLSERAGQMVQIRKSRQIPGQPDVMMVDLDQLVNKGNIQQNIEINGGDVIFIPEAGAFFVDGAVKRPGSYAIKHRTVVQEALVEAGGLETWAAKDRAKLVRLMPNGERNVIDLDLNQSIVKEMTLQDRDILIVETSKAASSMKAFGISFLGTGFSYTRR